MKFLLLLFMLLVTNFAKAHRGGSDTIIVKPGPSVCQTKCAIDGTCTTVCL